MTSATKRVGCALHRPGRPRSPVTASRRPSSASRGSADDVGRNAAHWRSCRRGQSTCCRRCTLRLRHGGRHCTRSGGQVRDCNACGSRGSARHALAKRRLARRKLALIGAEARGVAPSKPGAARRNARALLRLGTHTVMRCTTTCNDVDVGLGRSAHATRQTPAFPTRALPDQDAPALSLRRVSCSFLEASACYYLASFPLGGLPRGLGLTPSPVCRWMPRKRKTFLRCYIACLAGVGRLA